MTSKPADKSVLDADPENVESAYDLAIRTFPSREELDTPRTFEEWIATTGLDAADLEFQGSPYNLLTDKGILINRPFGIRAWKFSLGNFGPFVIAYCVAADSNEMFILTDGSTGIYRQLEEVTEKRENFNHPSPQAGLVIRNGLRVSEYGLTEENVVVKLNDPASVRVAKTYYLA